MRLIKFILLCFFSVTYFVSIYAQNSEVDSLIKCLKICKPDTNKLNTLSSIINLSADDDVWKIYNVELGTLSLQLQKSTNRKIQQTALVHYASFLSNEGYYYLSKGDATKALNSYQASLKISEQIHDKDGIANVFRNLGFIFEKQGNIKKALDYYHKGLVIAEEINDLEGVAVSELNMGSLYLAISDEKKGIEYFLKCIATSKKCNDWESQASALNNLGTIYSEKDTSKAFYYLRESLKLELAHGDKYGIATSFYNIGNAYEKSKNFKEALIYFKKSFEIDKETDNKNGLSYGYQKMGDVFLQQNNYKDALSNGLMSLKLARELAYPSNIENAASLLKDVYSKQKNFEKAFEMQSLFYTMRDSILNEENKKEGIKKQFEYEYDKKEAVAKVEQDKKDLAHTLQSKQQKTIIYSVVFGLIVIVFSSFFLYRRFLITKKQKHIIELQKQKVDEAYEELNQQNEEIAAQRDEIEQQKNLVEEHQKEIIDSIQYAQRIQKALLTSHHYIKKYLNEYFILYKPKDIVSGDFYWMLKKDDFLYVAVADCTGHGVPGAFMSMIGINLLNEIILERNVSNPALVLDIMREEIIRNLNPEGAEEESKDGMDMILCKFNLATFTLDFAAANNAVYIVRNENSSKVQEVVSSSGSNANNNNNSSANIKNLKTQKLIELKADKMPVGMYHDKITSFTKQSIQLKEGDTVYLITDGYADQFGGPKGKKFKYKQFEDLILNNTDLSMSQQENILSDKFNSWKGSLEQVDDVTVVGIKL